MVLLLALKDVGDIYIYNYIYVYIYIHIYIYISIGFNFNVTLVQWVNDTECTYMDGTSLTP